MLLQSFLSLIMIKLKNLWVFQTAILKKCRLNLNSKCHNTINLSRTCNRTIKVKSNLRYTRLGPIYTWRTLTGVKLNNN